MASYPTRVKADIAHWQSKGLIGPELAAQLGQDVEQRHRAGISFGAVIGTLAAILLAGGLLNFTRG